MNRIVLALSSLVFAVSALAQQGLPTYGSFESSPFDAVNLQSLNVNFAIPIVSSPGRGLDLKFAISYNSLIWNPILAWTPVTNEHVPRLVETRKEK